MLGRRWGQLCPTYPIPLASQLFPRLSYSSYPHTSRWAPLPCWQPLPLPS